MVNPFQPPQDVSHPGAIVTVDHRDRIGWGATKQVYHFESRLPPEQQVELAAEFFANRGATEMQFDERTITFRRGRTGWRQWFTSHEQHIPQFDRVRVCPSTTPTYTTVCEITYELHASLQWYIPPHFLQIEVKLLADLSLNAACWTLGVMNTPELASTIA